MRKIYSILCLAILGLVGFSAQAEKIGITITVDDASRVVVQTMGTGFIPTLELIALENGSNQVEVNLGGDLKIFGSDGDLVSVYYMNYIELGEDIIPVPEEKEIVDNICQFQITEEYEGKEIAITTKASAGGDDPVIPVENCQVTFDFADEASQAAILNVTIQGNPIENWAAGFEVEAGTEISIEYDLNAQFEVFTANGEDVFMILGNAPVRITENTVIVVKVQGGAPVSSEINFTIEVDDPANVEVGYRTVDTSWGIPIPVVEPFALVAGENHLTLDSNVSTTVVVEAKTGAKITSLLVDGSDYELGDPTQITVAEGMSIVIATAKVSRDAVCTVICDDIDAVTLVCGMNSVLLTSEEQQVEFYSDSESTFSFTPVSYEVQILSITLNDEPVSAPGFGTTWNVYNVQNGDVIVVKTKADDATVTLTFADELSRSYITAVKVNNEEVQLADVLYVKVGNYVEFIVDNNDMETVEFTVTGSQLQTYPNSYGFTVDGNTEVFVSAKEKEKSYIYINVDKAEQVDVYYQKLDINIMGMPYMKTVSLPLSDGENEVECSVDMKTIWVKAQDGFEVESITVDGATIVLDEEATEIFVVKDMRIEITSKQAVEGIESIIANGANVTVYTLGGVQLMKDASAQQLSKLPAGIYVINGRKVRK